MTSYDEFNPIWHSTSGPIMDGSVKSSLTLAAMKSASPSDMKARLFEDARKSGVWIGCDHLQSQCTAASKDEDVKGWKRDMLNDMAKNFHNTTSDYHNKAQIQRWFATETCSDKLEEQLSKEEQAALEEEQTARERERDELRLQWTKLEEERSTVEEERRAVEKERCTLTEYRRRLDEAQSKLEQDRLKLDTDRSAFEKLLQEEAQRKDAEWEKVSEEDVKGMSTE